MEGNRNGNMRGEQKENGRNMRDTKAGDTVQQLTPTNAQL